MEYTFYDKVQEAAEYIKSETNQRPTIGIILGSGLGSLVDIMENKEIISYKDIPHFPQSNVVGHAGNLVFGTIGGQRIVVMAGRFHFYEGYTMKEVTYPIYVMKLLGIENIIVTNACGGINRSFEPGDLMLIDDYVNLTSMNPLIGDNDERFGTRFPDMSQPYSEKLLNRAREVANNLLISYKQGVYAFTTGPCYESAAEIRAYERLGCDAIGMSTVPETIAANYMGVNVLGIACITNMATGIAKVEHSHAEVVKVANIASEKLCKWVEELIKGW